MSRKSLESLEDLREKLVLPAHIPANRPHQRAKAVGGEQFPLALRGTWKSDQSVGWEETGAEWLKAHAIVSRGGFGLRRLCRHNSSSPSQLGVGLEYGTVLPKYMGAMYEYGAPCLGRVWTKMGRLVRNGVDRLRTPARKAGEQKKKKKFVYFVAYRHPVLEMER
jgi:hypothetical protein